MNRGIARSIRSQSPVVAIAAVLVCVAISVFSVLWVNVPKLKAFLNSTVQKYDIFLPEITFKDGHASIREKQPYFIDIGGGKEVVIAIDTREGKEREVLDYLDKAESGAVLTRDGLLIKGDKQIRMIPLQDMPDFVFNSRNLQDLLDQYQPTIIRFVTILTIIYFLFVKPLQVLILGLIPHFGARAYSVSLTFGESMRIASIVMIPVVLVDTLVHLTGIRLPAGFILYFGLYIALLCLVVRDLVRNPGGETESFAKITP